MNHADDLTQKTRTLVSETCHFIKSQTTGIRPTGFTYRLPYPQMLTVSIIVHCPEPNIRPKWLGEFYLVKLSEALSFIQLNFLSILGKGVQNKATHITVTRKQRGSRRQLGNYNLQRYMAMGFQVSSCSRIYRTSQIGPSNTQTCEGVSLFKS